MGCEACATFLVDSDLSSKEYMDKFSARLRQARIGAGFSTAAAFARALNCEIHTYRMYDRGDRSPPLEMLAEVSRLTGKSADWLLNIPPKK